MWGSTQSIPCTKQPIHSHHSVVTPLILIRSIIFRPTSPSTRTGCVRPHNVWLRHHKLRVHFFWINIVSCPNNRLSNSHPQKVFPTNDFFVGVLKSFFGNHTNWSTASLNFFKEGVISQTRRHRFVVYIISNHVLNRLTPGRLVWLSIPILGVGFQVKKISTHRAITILKTRQNDTILHLSHFCAHAYWQRISRCTTPWSVPSTAHSLACRMGFKYVRCASCCNNYSLRLEHIKVTAPHIKANCTCNPVRLLLVHQ